MVSATFLTVVECLQKQPQSSSLGIFDPSPQESDVEALPYGVGATVTHVALDGSVVLGA